MPETREEAVRRIVTLSCTGREKYGLAFDAGEKFGREAALREAMAAVASKAALWEKETKSYVGMLHETCGMRARCLRDAEKAILALIPVAGKEEKA